MSKIEKFYIGAMMILGRTPERMDSFAEHHRLRAWGRDRWGALVEYSLYAAAERFLETERAWAERAS